MAEKPDPHHFLYPGALHHVSKWKRGRLEARSAVYHSSQTLCVSVFGALDGHPESAPIISAICRAAGVSVPAETPEIECEVRSHPELLNEYGAHNPTSPDVLVRWPSTVLAVESKFRERLSGCNQVKPAQRRKGEPKGSPRKPPACTGNHESGSDTKTKTNSPCRLTIQDGDRTPRWYWKIGAELFEPEVLVVPRRPCPFKDGTYQLMRNICFAFAYAAKAELDSFGFIVCYVEGARGAASTRREIAEFKKLLRPEVRTSFGALPYEEIAEILATHGDHSLARWITRRLAEGLGTRGAAV